MHFLLLAFCNMYLPVHKPTSGNPFLIQISTQYAVPNVLQSLWDPKFYNLMCMNYCKTTEFQIL